MHRLKFGNARLEFSTARLDALSRRLSNKLERLERVESNGEEPLREVTVMGDCEWQRDLHVTGAHDLIRLWPTVKQVLYAAQVDINGNNVLEAEENAETSQPKHFEALREYRQYSHLSYDLEQTKDRTSGCRDFCLLDKCIIQTLLKNYVKHMHILHPLLDLNVVCRAFRRLKLRQAERQPYTSNIMKAVDCAQSIREQCTHPQSDHYDCYPAADMMETYGDFEQHPLLEAILLLVLAIGSVCGEKAERPQNLFKATSRLREQLAERTSSFQHFKHQRSSSEDSCMHSSARDDFSHGWRSETEAAKRDWCGKNPSMAFYLQATKIIGTYTDQDSLLVAQASLLAGIYKGQLGRVCDSMNWIHLAGRACQTLLRQHRLLDNRTSTSQRSTAEAFREMQSRIKGPTDNLVLLSSWTCIQLESDILAELPLTPSGIQNHEDAAPWPSSIPGFEAYNQFLSEPERREIAPGCDILTVYTAQLWLRKRLNQIQKWIYGKSCLSLSLATLRETLKGYRDDLHIWRQGLPVALRWSDDEPPASDILAARLRAKFYGGCYIATRPFLDFALHMMAKARDGHDLTSIAVRADGSPRGRADVHIFEAINGIPDSEIWQTAKECVKAAVHSTYAFDGIPHQLIVTNIHGTAHA